MAAHRSSFEIARGQAEWEDDVAGKTPAQGEELSH